MNRSSPQSAPEANLAKTKPRYQAGTGKPDIVLDNEHGTSARGERPCTFLIISGVEWMSYQASVILPPNSFACGFFPSCHGGPCCSTARVSCWMGGKRSP